MKTTKQIIFYYKADNVHEDDITVDILLESS